MMCAGTQSKYCSHIYSQAERTTTQKSAAAKSVTRETFNVVHSTSYTKADYYTDRLLELPLDGRSVKDFKVMYV
jgi:hypothetical protein